MKNPYNPESEKTPRYKVYEYLYGGLIKIDRLKTNSKGEFEIIKSQFDFLFKVGDFISHDLLNSKFKFKNYSETK